MEPMIFFLHSFCKRLLSTYYVLERVPDTEGVEINRTHSGFIN